MMGQIWVLTHSPVIGDWIEPKYARVEASRALQMVEQHNRPGPRHETWYVELLECAT